MLILLDVQEQFRSCFQAVIPAEAACSLGLFISPVGKTCPQYCCKESIIWLARKLWGLRASGIYQTQGGSVRMEAAAAHYAGGWDGASPAHHPPEAQLLWGVRNGCSCASQHLTCFHVSHSLNEMIQTLLFSLCHPIWGCCLPDTRPWQLQ